MKSGYCFTSFPKQKVTKMVILDQPKLILLKKQIAFLLFLAV